MGYLAFFNYHYLQKVSIDSFRGSIMKKTISSKRNFTRILLCVAVFAASPLNTESIAQNFNIGIPPVRNFINKEYRAGTQNWQITEDERGVIYTANNDGLLVYDGNHWRVYPIANGTSLRSVEIAPDGKIFVGGQGEIGFFQGDANGILCYHSLNDYLPEENLKFEDVWEIFIDEKDVYFISQKMILKWDGNQISVPIEGEGYLFAEKVGDHFLVQKANYDLGIYENGLESSFNKISKLSTEVTSIITFNQDSILLTTDKNAIYLLQKNKVNPWPTKADDFLKKNRIFCSGKLPNGNLVFGTTSAGVVVMDENRRLLQHVSKEDNLQNNTILSIFSDKIGNLWMGLDNGISYIQTNSAITEFFPDGKLEGTCYTASIYENNLYTGTNTGVYRIEWKPYYFPEEKKNFELIPNSQGQVWSIGEYQNKLLVGHQNGPYTIREREASRLAGLLGVWQYVPYLDDYLIAGHYSGIGLFKQKEDGLEYLGMMEGLDESSRLLAYDGATIWMAHPYRGIYQIDLSIENKQVTYNFYDADNGLPSNNNNHLFQLNDRVVFTGERGVFRFDSKKNIFLPDEGFNEIFGSQNRVKYLKQDKRGNIWYVVENEVGVLKIKDKALDKQIERMPIPELSGKLVRGFEFIFPVDEKNVLFATEKGFIHFDPTRYNVLTPALEIVLSEVWLKTERDSLLFGGHVLNGQQAIIPNLNPSQNGLKFIFSSTDHEGYEFVTYSHFLEGSEVGWSAWDRNTTLDINNLRPGDYSLHLKAKNKFGKESTITSFQFIINPPWYASNFAFTIYGFLLIGAFISLAFFQNKKHEKEKAFMEITHMQEQEKKEELVRQSKEKINELERQKLETEVQFKNQELAAATMNLLQKSEMMSSIQASLEKMKKQNGKNEDIYQEINRLLKLVKSENDIDQDWERFSVHFDQVHSDFLKRLGEYHPNLSPNDYKLSAYLRMNLSSKEIAALMNISIRGVEAGRYRLRKRLELDGGENLTEYLIRL